MPSERGQVNIPWGVFAIVILLLVLLILALTDKL